MMKKGFLVTAMVCMLSVASVMCVHAEEAQTEPAAVEIGVPVKTITWDDNMQQMFVNDGFAGTIMDIDALGMQMMVPEGMEQRQPTEEEKKQDTKLVFENKEKEQKIELVVGQIGDCKTLDDVKAFLEEKVPGIVVNPTKINEYDTLVYGREETNSMCVLIGAGDAGFLRVICRPCIGEQNAKLCSYVAASIQEIKN